MASKSSKARATFEAANLEAATIVLADPVKYPAGSLLQEWAALVLQRANVLETVNAKPAPLFDGEASS
jgi:hypothetical protein